jgi:hypothetical protein
MQTEYGDIISPFLLLLLFNLFKSKKCGLKWPCLSYYIQHSLHSANFNIASGRNITSGSLLAKNNI